MSCRFFEGRTCDWECHWGVRKSLHKGCRDHDVAWMGEGDSEDGDEEGAEGMPVMLEGERLGLERDGEVIRKLPKLLSEAEVEEHWVMGHLPYRDWCPVCIRAKGK